MADLPRPAGTPATSPAAGVPRADPFVRAAGLVDPRRREQLRARGLWGDASLDDFWRLSVLAAPGRTAVVDSRGTRLTYAEVDDRAARIATWLRSVGVRPGDVVSVQLPSWAEFLCLDVACLRIGAVVGPVLTASRETELRHVLDRCGSRVLVVPTVFRGARTDELAARLVADPGLPGLTAVAVVEHEGVPAAAAPTLDAVVAAHTPLPEHDRTPGRGTDVAAVLFTSGSEARPKGVLLSHDNVISGERAFAAALGISSTDRVFMPAPLGHATGYLHGLTLPYLVGATSLLLDVPAGPASLAMIRAERATCGMAAASVITCLLDACPDTEALPRELRFLGCGGSPVPRALARRALDHGVRLLSVYGSTESAPHTLTTPHDSTERVLTTDGRPVDGVQVRVVDPVTRRPVPVGTVGEEASRGPQVFLGYLDEPGLTAAVLDEAGWYYSGDLAVLDPDGYLRIVGRAKDVIIRGGENISAAEVEAVLRDCPGVRDAAVVAMPDRRLGECACAFLVPEPGPAARPGTVRVPDVAALRQEFLARGLAKYKIPARVVVVDDLPRSPAGKVRKDLLRERAEHLAGHPDPVLPTPSPAAARPDPERTRK
ncbi:MAG TPA: AMP-binding protein [Cellulomonas sp.]